MSSPPRRLGLAYRERQVELVEKIIEKTIQKKLAWVRTASAFSASAPGMDFSFVVTSPIPILSISRDWVLFTVRDQGKEILKVENTGTSVQGLLGGLVGVPDALREAINKLFALVSGLAQGEIDKAIDKLDRI